MLQVLDYEDSRLGKPCFNILASIEVQESLTILRRQWQQSKVSLFRCTEVKAVMTKNPFASAQ